MTEHDYLRSVFREIRSNQVEERKELQSMRLAYQTTAAQVQGATDELVRMRATVTELNQRVTILEAAAKGSNSALDGFVKWGGLVAAVAAVIVAIVH